MIIDKEEKSSCMIHASYKYSLTAQQQSAIQEYLRLLPDILKKSEEWELLHKLTYAEDWSDHPRYPTVDVKVKDSIFQRHHSDAQR